MKYLISKTELANVNILHGEQYEHGAVVAVWCNNVHTGTWRVFCIQKEQGMKIVTELHGCLEESYLLAYTLHVCAS